METFTLSSLKQRRTPHELAARQRLQFDLLIARLTGSGTHEVDFEPARLGADQILHVRPGQIHRFALDDGYDARLVLLRPFQNRRNWKPGPNVLSPDAQTQSDLGAALDLARSEGRAAPLSEASIEAVHTLLIELLGLRSAPAPDASLGERVFADFERLLGGPVLPPRTVADCALAVGCSPRTLGRACAEFANASPKQMIDKAIAMEGQRLLALGDITATEVGERLGFVELAHFSRFLSRVTGKSPTAFAIAEDR